MHFFFTSFLPSSWAWNTGYFDTENSSSENICNFYKNIWFISTNQSLCIQAARIAAQFLCLPRPWVCLTPPYKKKKTSCLLETEQITLPQTREHQHCIHYRMTFKAVIHAVRCLGDPPLPVTRFTSCLASASNWLFQLISFGLSLWLWHLTRFLLCLIHFSSKLKWELAATDVQSVGIRRFIFHSVGIQTVREEVLAGGAALYFGSFFIYFLSVKNSQRRH